MLCCLYPSGLLVFGFFLSYRERPVHSSLPKAGRRLAAFAGRGFTPCAVELRGFGRTPERPRGHIGSFRIWYRDILELRDIIGRDFPGKKVFLLGESMGGLLAFNLACP